MSAMAFNMSGAYRQRQKSTGKIKVSRSSSGFCEVTAEHSGVGIFAAGGTKDDIGYFRVSLQKNGEQVAKGDFNSNTGFVIYFAKQYAGGGCSIALKVKKGDVLKFSCRENADSGDGTVYWSFVVFG